MLLVNRLGRTEVVELRWAVGGHDDHRDGGLMGFNNGGVQFHGSGAAGGEDHGRQSGGNTETEGHEPGGPLIVMHVELELIARGQGQRHWR